MKILSLKKFFIILFSLVVISINPAFSGELNSQLTKIENEIWGYNYEKDTDEVRLDRIEKQIFGDVKTNLDGQKRVDRITKSLGIESIEDEKKSLSDLYVAEEAGIGAEYPIVDSLETSLLGSVYKTDNINKRLERLEVKIFGSKQEGDLSERTDALKRYITGEPQQTAAAPYYNTYEPAYNPDSDETKLQLAALENLMFGTDFGKEDVSQRLTRLENKIFQRNFKDDSFGMRIQRIQAAATAGKTAKYYDNNKLNKFTSTGMQIGTFLLMILAFIL